MTSTNGKDENPADPKAHVNKQIHTNRLGNGHVLIGNNKITARIYTIMYNFCNKSVVDSVRTGYRRNDNRKLSGVTLYRRTPV